MQATAAYQEGDRKLSQYYIHYEYYTLHELSIFCDYRSMQIGLEGSFGTHWPSGSESSPARGYLSGQTQPDPAKHEPDPQGLAGLTPSLVTRDMLFHKPQHTEFSSYSFRIEFYKRWKILIRDF